MADNVDSDNGFCCFMILIVTCASLCRGSGEESFGTVRTETCCDWDKNCQAALRSLHQDSTARLTKASEGLTSGQDISVPWTCGNCSVALLQDDSS